MINKNPLVSIIVPLYNYQNYICDCISSIKKQDYNNYELIIVDDCSTDKSYKKAKKFENDKIKVIKLKRNYGYSKAKNEGIIRSKGDFITTLDSDDMVTKTSLSSRIKAILKNKVSFVYANAIVVNGNIKLKECYNIKKPDIFYSVFYEIHAQTVLMSRNVYKKYGLYDENLRSRADREMWWRLFGKSNKEPCKITYCYLNKCVAYYRKHSKSMWITRQRNKAYNKKIRKKAEDAYLMRKKEGITNKNTRFLEE